MSFIQRIVKALNYEQADKLPVDFGGGLTTGINIKTIYNI